MWWSDFIVNFIGFRVTMETNLWGCLAEISSPEGGIPTLDEGSTVTWTGNQDEIKRTNVYTFNPSRGRQRQCVSSKPAWPM